MTDNEIIKALENIINEKIGCCAEDCAFYDGKVHSCEQTIAKHSLDLINRQKAEIERHREHIELLDIEHEAIKISEIKKFIKRFEKKIKDVKYTIGQTWEIQSALKEVEKEMAGEQNAPCN